jgi:ribosome biogenesis GTPase
VSDLVDLGWTDARAAQFEAASEGRAHLFPGRVSVAYNHLLRVLVEGGEWDAVISGRLKHRATRRAELPAVGDWVVVRRRPDEDRAAVVEILPRASAFSRKEAGEVTEEQVVAANIDVVFVVTALDGDFSPRRVERYLILTREGGAAPVVLLTKPDRCDDVAGATAQMQAIAGEAPVHVVNPRAGEGLDSLWSYLGRGRSCALLGSSGVGKSTLVNRLLGMDVQRTRTVREADSKGRHTTTHRELVRLPSGGVLVDTPGMREVQLWEAGDAVEQSFADVESFASRCHFTDCQHVNEPRCAVKAAVDDGSLSEGRLASYLALQGELRQLEARHDARARQEARRMAKSATRALNERLRTKYR